MKSRTPVINALLAAVVLVLATRTAQAHTPPPVYLTSELSSEELVVTCVVGAELFKDWFGVDPVGWNEREEELRAADEQKIEDFVSEWGGIVADGIPVKGVFRELENVVYEDHEQPWKFVHVKIAYGMKAMPAQLSLVWKRFENSIGWWLEYIQGEILVDGYGGRYFDFSEGEPEYIWHRPATPRVSGGISEPSYSPPQPITVHLASLLVLVALAVAVPCFRRFKVRRLVSWGFVVVGVALTFGLRGMAQIEVMPPWQSAVSIPDKPEAKRIFESLHRNIYRAFDYKAEQDVYDTLALSVMGPLLDRLYAEIMESLIMQDQGGAVSRIQGVRILDSEIELPENEDLPEFSITCTWQVKGRVTHWGHTHERVNEYKARYRVESDGERWKIATVETLDERRLDEDEAARTWEDPEGG